MVNVASTFVGIGNIDKVQRWSKKEKAYIEVDRPEAIKFYNDFMGGVDLMDRLISLLPYDIPNEMMANKTDFTFTLPEYSQLLDRVSRRRTKKIYEKKPNPRFVSF